MGGEAMRRMSITNVSRRGLLGAAGASAFVLAVGLPRQGRAQDAQEVQEFGRDAMPNGWSDDPNVFVSIAEDGLVTITVHRSEMGQGVRTSIAMVVADELGAEWQQVRVAQAPGLEERYGNQDTDGSRSLRHFFMPMRRAGAAARVMLEEAAAAEWGVDPSEVRADGHRVAHAGSGRSLGYGELAMAARDAAVPDPDGLALKDPSEFRYIGRSDVGLVDNTGITTGSAIYGIDVRRDGMLYAVVARPPVYGGRVRSYDDAAALAIAGVEKVVAIEPVDFPTQFSPLGGLAVIARNTHLAIKGRDALVIEWEDGPNAGYDSEAYRETLSAAAGAPGGTVVRDEGDLDAAMADAAQTLEAEYYIPHLAQAPMEPPAAVVEIRDGKAEAWACTQAPQVTRLQLAERLGLAPEDVTVNVTLLGGGFGRKSKPDFVFEAAECSRAMDGAPVKLTWTREDDIRHGYYHTVSVEKMSGGLDEGGRPVAWLHRTAAPTIGSIFAPDPKHQLPFELGMGLLNMPLAIDNIRAENPEAAAHVRIGWYRAVSNIPHAFAIQSFVAELADAAGRDPKDYLLEVIGPARRIDPTEQGDVWNYGENPDALPDRHGPHGGRGRGGGPRHRVGPRDAPGRGPRHRRALQLRQLRGGGLRGRGRGRHRVRAAGLHRHRLRRAGEPRPHPLADGGGGDHGPGPGADDGGHLRGRPGAAGQLRHLPDPAHGGLAEANRRRAGGGGRLLRPSARGRGRARAAAGGAGDRQRGLRRDRHPHPPAAHRRPAARLTGGPR